MRIKVIWILCTIIFFISSLAFAQNTINVGQAFQIGFSYPASPVITGFKCYRASTLVQTVPYSSLVAGNGLCQYPAQTTAGTITIGVSAYDSNGESVQTTLSITVNSVIPPAPTNIHLIASGTASINGIITPVVIDMTMTQNRNNVASFKVNSVTPH